MNALAYLGVQAKDAKYFEKFGQNREKQDSEYTKRFMEGNINADEDENEDDYFK